MLILLEGPDCSGKTTLAEKLRRRLSGDTIVLHRGPPEADMITEYALALQVYRPGQGIHVICDRWHWGEEVYGPILRGGSQFEPATFHHVEKVLAARGAVVALCLHREDELVRRMRERGDDLVDEKQVGAILDGYFEVSDQSELPFYSFRDPTDEHVEQIVRYAEIFEQSAGRLLPFESYVGSTNPPCLILGERRNDGPRSELLGPVEAAFTPAPSTSGLYLLRHLDPVVLRNCGIANACEEDVRHLWTALGRPATVALGAPAAAATAAAGVPHGSAPHPQYIRRFYHRAAEEYGRTILRALRDEEKLATWKPTSDT